MSVVGRGVVEGHLTPEEVSDLVRQGLERLPLDGKRVIVLIPDGTRTMPMPLMFEILERELLPDFFRLDEAALQSQNTFRLGQGFVIVGGATATCVA